MINYLCCNCDEPVGQSQEPILADGVTILCTKCSKLPIFAHQIIFVDLSIPILDTKEFDQQMAGELEGSFLLLEGSEK